VHIRMRVRAHFFSIATFVSCAFKLALSLRA
jgi:hypothetical protein